MLVNYKYCILNILRDFIVKTSNIMFMLRKEDNFDYIEIIVFGFSSSRAGRQQLRESCRLQRTAEPRAKAPWFGNPPLPTTEKGTHFRVPFIRGWRFASRFSSSKARWQQLRESCRLRRTAEPRAKALWFGIHPFSAQKAGTINLVPAFCGGKGWIRTTEDMVGRFTVCSLWPLGNLPLLELVTGIEPATC